MRLLTFIPHYNKDHRSELLLQRCLRSIKKYEPRQLYSTVIVNDAGPHPFATFAKELMDEFPGLIVFEKDKNTSYSDVINMGLDYAQTSGFDVMLTLNNDVEILTPYNNLVVDFYKRIPDLMVLGGLLLFPTGRIQSAGFTTDANGETIGFMEFEKNEHYSPECTPAAYATRFVEGVTGAMQFIRVKEAVEIGGYSTNFKMSYEDVEFCLRSWSAGFKCLYSHQIKAIHSESTTRGYLIGPRELQSLKEVLVMINTLDIGSIKNQVQKTNSFYKSQGLK